MTVAFRSAKVAFFRGAKGDFAGPAGIAIAKRNEVYQGRKVGSLKTDTARALALRSKGLNDTEIATALGLARRTVQRYLHA